MTLVLLGGLGLPAADPARALVPQRGDVSCSYILDKSGQVQFSGRKRDPTLVPEMDCACPDACTRATRRSTDNCTEAVAECEPNVQYLDGVAVLEGNSVYRVTDILMMQGMRWRLDAVRALCDSRYRGTLLREVLRRTATLDGCLLDEAGYERAWCGTREGLVVSSAKAGWPRCMKQAAPGRCRDFVGAGLERALSSRSDTTNASLRGHFNLTGRAGAGASGLHLGGAISFAWPFEAEAAVPTLAALHLETLHQVLSERQAKPETRCETADNATLVVPLRMGDFLPTTARHVMDIVRHVMWRFPGTLKRVVFSGVMHYGSNEYLVEGRPGSHGGTAQAYMRTAQTDAMNRDFLSNLSSLAVDAGLAWRIRSEPIADKDICYLVFSPHVLLPPGRGFGVVLSKLRASLRMATDRVARGMQKTLTCVSPEGRVRPLIPDWGPEWGETHDDILCYADGPTDSPGDERGDATKLVWADADFV